jgi:hypothetical protein
LTAILACYVNFERLLLRRVMPASRHRAACEPSDLEGRPEWSRAVKLRTPNRKKAGTTTSRLSRKCNHFNTRHHATSAPIHDRHAPFSRTTSHYSGQQDSAMQDPN